MSVGDHLGDVVRSKIEIVDVLVGLEILVVEYGLVVDVDVVAVGAQRVLVDERIATRQVALPAEQLEQADLDANGHLVFQIHSLEYLVGRLNGAQSGRRVAVRDLDAETGELLAVQARLVQAVLGERRVELEIVRILAWYQVFGHVVVESTVHS